MSAEMCDTDTAAQLLEALAETRRTLEQMRDDLTRMDASLDALRREAIERDSETKRGIGQVVSKLDRRKM